MLLTRARVALGVKLVLALISVVLIATLASGSCLALVLALGFIGLSAGLDYWVWRALGNLFLRLQQLRAGSAAVQASEAQRKAGRTIEELIDDLLHAAGPDKGLETLHMEEVRGDLYRLRRFNDQLIRLGEIAQELNAALPFRETKALALERTRQLLAADVVVLVREEGGDFTLEGITGCEEGDVDVACCSYYSRCPVRTSFRSVQPAIASETGCRLFPPTLRSQLSLPFRLDDGRVMALLAGGAAPDAFADVSEMVLQTLLGHVQTALRAAQKYDHIRREAVTDPLTNLYNRRFFEKRAQEELERSLRHQQPLTLLMYDIDHFKEINDAYGHQTGDKVLQTVAGFLNESVRKSDICGRYGGEEFVLLLPATPGRNAAFLADRLRTGISQLIYTGLGVPSDTSVTISGGLATCPHDGTSLQELVAKADAALYEAKRMGRNRVLRASHAVPSPPQHASHPSVAPSSAGRSALVEPSTDSASARR